MHAFRAAAKLEDATGGANQHSEDQTNCAEKILDENERRRGNGQAASGAPIEDSDEKFDEKWSGC